MNRKIAFIIMLLLCLSTGIASCGIVYMLTAQPATPLSSAVPIQATLSAPAVTEQAPEATEEEIVLPTLPAVSEIATVPETTASEMTEPSEEAFEEPEPQYHYTASHSSQRLFIRDDASIQAKIIGYLMPGESGEVISIGESWVLLKHGNIEGYVFKEYLEIKEIPLSTDSEGS